MGFFHNFRGWNNNSRLSRSNQQDGACGGRKNAPVNFFKGVKKGK